MKAINEFRNTTKYLFMYISFSDTCYIKKIEITVYGLSKLLLLEFLSKSLNKTNEMMRPEIHLKVLCEMLQIVYNFQYTVSLFFPKTFFIEFLAYVLYALNVLIRQSGSYKILFSTTFKYQNK